MSEREVLKMINYTYTKCPIAIQLFPLAGQGSKFI